MTKILVTEIPIFVFFMVAMLKTAIFDYVCTGFSSGNMKMFLRKIMKRICRQSWFRRVPGHIGSLFIIDYKNAISHWLTAGILQTIQCIRFVKVVPQINKGHPHTLDYYRPISVKSGFLFGVFIVQ